MTENGSQFASKFMLETYRIPGVKELFTTTYRSQTNRQTEMINQKICSALRKFVRKLPRYWDLYTYIITYAYNTLYQEYTDVAPFDLVVSRPPPA